MKRIDPAEVISAYQAGQSVEKIAQGLGEKGLHCTGQAVWKVLVKAGVPRRHPKARGQQQRYLCRRLEKLLQKGPARFVELVRRSHAQREAVTEALRWLARSGRASYDHATRLWSEIRREDKTGKLRHCLCCGVAFKSDVNRLCKKHRTDDGLPDSWVLA